MDITVINRHRWRLELRDRPDLTGLPLASRDVTDDLGDAIDEAITNGFLGEYLPAETPHVLARIAPRFKTSPVVERLDVALGPPDGDPRVTLPFTSGAWHRWSQRTASQLREEGTLAQEQPVYQLLLALPEAGDVPIPLPALRAPEVREATLESCGVRQLLDGELTPDRPVLVSRRFEEDAIEQCERYQRVEIGAAALGRTVRLPEPLPGTRTRVVTLLSTLLFDERHRGDEAQFHFDPAALAEAQRMCDLRAQDESIITVFHTHGWGCGECNQKTLCPIAEAKPSLQDYQLLATLFPGKSTLMPIAGRKSGDVSRRPVLQVYAWRTGQMRPIRWQRYDD